MERFLIVRLSAIGDIVHTIPVAAALRRAFPSARIDWLVSAGYCELLDLVPIVDRQLRIVERLSAGAVRALGVVLRELRSGRYDAVLDVQGLIKSALLARASGAPRVLGFSSNHVRERLARVFYTDMYDPGGQGLLDPLETRHVVDINLGLLRLLGVTAPLVEFPIASIDSVVARNVAGQAGASYALLNPGAAWPNKRWPSSRLGAVAAGLRARHGLASMVLWGPGERVLAEEAVAASKGAASLLPPTTIADVVALARGAAVMVSADTGPAHIATAVGTPLVGIYGPTRPSRNGPMGRLDVTVSRDTICQCLYLRRCRQARMCLLDIEVDEVVGAVERRLAGEASTRVP